MELWSDSQSEKTTQGMDLYSRIGENMGALGNLDLNSESSHRVDVTVIQGPHDKHLWYLTQSRNLKLIQKFTPHQRV